MILLWPMNYKRGQKYVWSGGAWGKRAVYSTAEHSLLSFGNTPTMHRKPQQQQKPRGESRASAFPAQKDFNKNALDVNSHLCFFIASKQKAAPGTAFTKDPGSRKGRVGTDINPHHAWSKRNTRNKACWIKRLPDWSLWQEKILC